jgi:PAS domain S-box-containing protein
MLRLAADSLNESRFSHWVRRATPLTRSVRFLMTASGVCFVLVVNMLIGYGIWQQREDALHHIHSHAGELAGLLRDLSEQSLRQIERVSSDLASQLKAYDAVPALERFNMQELLFQHMEAFPQIANILLINPDGAVRARAKELPIRFDGGLTISQIIAPHLKDPNHGFTIAAPAAVPYRGAGVAIPASRPVENRLGEVTGILLILLDPDYQHSLFAERTPPRGGAAALVGGNGVVAVAQTENPSLLPVHLSEWGELSAAVARAPAGGELRLSRHGVDYVVGFRRMERFDYSVLVFQNLAPALADWRRDAVAWAAIGMAMTLAISVLTLYVVRQHERREADQAELLNASQRIRGILDSMLDAVVTIDGRGRIQTFNSAATRLFDYRESDILGQSINMLVPPQHHHQHDGFNPVVISQNSGPRLIGADQEILAVRRDGSTFPITLSVTHLPAADGVPPEQRSYVGVIRDITKRKQFEADLMASKHAAELANHSKSEFLANMSHELRTPLNAVIGFSEMLDSEFFGALNERQKSCTRDIHDSGKHLLSVVNAILDMSKIEAGNYELKEEVIDPAETVAQCLQMVRSRAEDGGVTVINAIEGPLPGLWADRRAYQQVALNLLSNAVKFTPAGGSARIEAAVTDGAFELRVSDTGVGVPESFRPLLFQPFRQADHSASRQHDGIGLGLSIAKNLLQLHGGDLTYESEEGKGSTFTAIMPAARVLTRCGPGGSTSLT